MEILQHRGEQVASEGRELPTACVLCAHNCGLLVDVAGNRIVNIQADEKNPKSLGYSCNKGYSIAKYVEHAQRVTRPLRRGQSGQYEEVSWETAIREIGERLRAIIATHGGSAVAINGLGGQGNHLDIIYGLAFLTSAGSSWFLCTFAQEKTQHTLVDRWMMNAPTHAILHADAWHSNYMLVMGTNPVISHRNERPTQLFSEYKKDSKKRITVVDPRFTETARRADRHLAIVPGTDAYLLMGMIKHILDAGLCDTAFIDGRAVGFDVLKDVFAAVKVDDMSARCGRSAEEIRIVATEFATTKHACVFYDLGVEQIPFSTLVCWLIRVLLAITGNLAREGGNVFTPTFKPRTDPLEPRRHFRAPVSGIEGIPGLGPFAMFSPILLPEEIEAGNIRAVVVEGANPLISYPDIRRFQAALKKLELLVVIDPVFTETAREAHYVLPTPTGYEKWEYSTHNHRFPEIYAHLRPPVVQGPEQALPEAEIYSRLVQAIGSVPEPPRLLRWLARRNPRWSKPFKVALVARAMLRARGNRLRAVAYMTFWAYRLVGPWLPNPAVTSLWLNCQLFALTRRADALRALGPDFARQTPFAIGEALFQRIIDNPHGAEVGRVDEENHFRDTCRTPGHRVRLVPAPMIAELKRALQTRLESAADFPLFLCAGERMLWNANTLQRDPSWRKGKGPHFGVKMHPDLSRTLGVAQGDSVKVVTGTGSLVAPVIVSDTVRPDSVTLPNGFGMDYPGADGSLVIHGGKINLLTDLNDRDPFTGIPHNKRVPCRLEKI